MTALLAVVLLQYLDTCGPVMAFQSRTMSLLPEVSAPANGFYGSVWVGHVPLSMLNGCFGCIVSVAFALTALEDYIKYTSVILGGGCVREAYVSHRVHVQ